MKTMFVNFVAWVIRPAIQKVMREHYGSDELTEGQKAWFNNLIAPVSGQKPPSA